jgi:hypothetical protein
LANQKEMYMKKLLFLISLIISVSVFAQTQRFEAVSIKAPNQKVLPEPPTHNSSGVVESQSDADFQKSTDNLNGTFVRMGSAGNAYSTLFNGRTALWADPAINSVAFTHRMTGGTEIEGNSRIAYDVSTDGGATWQNDNHVYTPTGPDPGTGYPMAGGRYCQGAIINPEGNTDPNNAYYAYLSAALLGQNSIWGGLAFGSNSLTQIPPDATQNNWESGGDVWRLIPNAHHVTRDGIAWYVDESSQYDEGSATYNYLGDLLLGRGEIIDGEIQYTEELMSFLDEGEAFNDFKIAFAPDGQVGYIVAMTESASDPVDNTTYHPVLLKTEDGGESWSDPIHVQFGGEDGIENIKNYIPDTIITQLDFYADWSGDRDELIFYMGFYVDLVVDAMGNPYMLGLISLATDEGTWYPGISTEWALYSKDGGETFDADPLWDQIWFDGMVGDVSVYNRPQIGIDYDGEHVFYSWLDSEAEQAEENDRPNIYLSGYDIEEDVYTEVENVTYFTQAWNKAFLANQSYYVFTHGEFSFEIFFMYVEFTVPDDPLSDVYYWYIDDYILTPVDVPEFNASQQSFAVGQNYPNPATQQTEILVSADTRLPAELTISNMLGQVIYRDAATSSSISRKFSVDVSGFDPGLYLYSVKIGEKVVTKKMLVE